MVQTIVDCVQLEWKTDPPPFTWEGKVENVVLPPQPSLTLALMEGRDREMAKYT